MVLSLIMGLMDGPKKGYQEIQYLSTLVSEQIDQEKKDQAICDKQIEHQIDRRL